MKQRGFKWLFGILIVVLVAAICAACVFACVRPKLVLSSALSRLFSQLEERFQGDPSRMAAGIFDRDGKYTADVLLRAEREITGPVIYDIAAQADFSAHRFFADGTISSSENSVSASLYLDNSFAAVSSEELVQGSYYGITYDSFSSDIRSLPLLSPFVSEQALSRWTDSVQRIKEIMSWEYPRIAFPVLSKNDIRTLLMGIAALPCSMETVSSPINGETLSCQKLDYSFDGGQLGTILGKEAENAYIDGTKVFASFYLCDDAVVKFLIQYQQGMDTCAYDITFGMDPIHDRLTLAGNENLAGERRSYSVSVDTKRQENRLTQTISYSNGRSVPAVYTYEWESTAGTMYLKSDVLPEAAKLRLSKGDAGLQIETADLGRLLQVLMRNTQGFDMFNGTACSMDIRKGSQIDTPTYRNVDSWSFDDVLILLGGLGSMVGLDFA